MNLFAQLKKLKLLLPPVINPMFAEAAMILSEEPKESSLLKLEEQMEKEYGSGIGENIKHSCEPL